MEWLPVDSIAQIDLERHGLIEASAGTGKTYTLENLVIRILKERPQTRFENILMVTFTEKATCELRVRIREKIAAELRVASDAEFSGRLREALEVFDTAAIHTIHGFCRQLLEEFAFESRVPFEVELTDDHPLLHRLLREQMRREWPRIYGAELPELLYVAGYPRNPEAFLEKVVQVAATYRPQLGDRLEPDPQGRSPAQLRRQVDRLLRQLRMLAGPQSGFRAGFEKLHIHAATRRSLMDHLVRPLETFLTFDPATGPTLIATAEFLQTLQTSSPYRRGAGMRCLLPEKWLKKGANPEVCPDLERVASSLESLESVLGTLAASIPVEAIRRLQSQARAFKARRGWVSYDDLLSWVLAGIEDPAAGAFLRALRDRFHYAFVDEFQDTDPVQWRIFRKLFLEIESGRCGCRLFLIGDPKQAIYAFRGADIHAYLEARRILDRLSGGGQAQLYTLTTNWRSEPELIEAFNHLFGRDSWFAPAHAAGSWTIGYQPVHPPAGRKRPARLELDRSGRPALSIIDLSTAASLRSARQTLIDRIASEIRYLVDSKSLRITGAGSTPRYLDYGDICILVRSRRELTWLEKPLRARQIPFSFYRRPGLFDCDEALALDLTLRAVSDPGNATAVKKALLTPFFERRPHELLTYEALAPEHPLRRLITRCHRQAAQRRWGRLFQSLLEDSGMLYRLSGGDDWERAESNYRQLFEFLTTEAYSRNLDLRGMITLMAQGRRDPDALASEAGIHPIETERRKVQVMTLHVSKGLEFPVVFIAGGMTASPAGKWVQYHRPENGGVRKVIDLGTGGTRLAAQEQDSENKRLFYVGLTRARAKLYVPYYPATGRQVYFGPVCGFMAAALTEAYPEGHGRPEAGRIQSSRTLPAQGPDRRAQRPQLADLPPDTTVPDLPPPADFRDRITTVESFSSLHARDRLTAEDRWQNDFQPVEAAPREDDERSAEGFPDPTAHPDDEIPGGPDTGSMFHDVLEHIDYSLALRCGPDLAEAPAARQVITAAMDRYRVDRRWLPAVAGVVTGVLTTPVSLPSGPLVLGRLPPSDRLHEVEFYLRPSAAKAPSTDGNGPQPILLRGFVDLIFRHRDRYYLADWKSNRIETRSGRLAPEEIMRLCDYPLQYRIYVLALLRWLARATGGAFDPERSFGGVCYFFLRAMARGDQDGVVFVPPDKIGSPSELAAEIGARMQ